MSQQIDVFTINKNGFILHDLYRLEYEGYEPLPNEITEPIPPDNGGEPWFVHRWNGKKWVEGKDHPKAPKPEPNPDFPEVQLPIEGIFRLFSNDIKPAQAEKCLLESDLTASYVAEHLYCLNDPLIIKELIIAVQKLNERIAALEKAKLRTVSK